VLEGVNLSIAKGQRVGLVGRTGSGKSTCTDLLMALLEPTEGALLVDDRAVDRTTRRSWQRVVAHVPQSIFLSDTTLEENIAFGIPADEIDGERVRSAARQAQLADFIEGLADGYRTRVGERGVRLSGGQRQRIGIARALYKQAAVLIFDEATSALDNSTEKAVMEAINGLGRDLTVVLVAHRLTTVQDCDVIFEFEAGRIVAEGSFQHLMTSSASFLRMATTVES
jgi:ATP-binding cassette subfamily B protein